MLGRKAFTLIEIMAVLFIIGIITIFRFSNFTLPNEKAWAANAQNNLLAIYGAERNDYVNTGAYCINSSVPACDTLAHINTYLSLNIPDDGIYTYNCYVVQFQRPRCDATRNNAQSDPWLEVFFDDVINLSGSGTANPQCASSYHRCP